ncbi:MAG TPA: amidohydrolase [Thermoplasmata archaeon]|nr:amidohydrolase [Thermoplasmata archaeon]
MTDATLFVGGRIFTGRRYCAALLVEEGEVVLAGTEAEARRAAAPGTEVVPLGGDLVVPGLIDAHLHVAEVTRAREGLDVREIGSAAALGEAIGRWASDHPNGPIEARGWDPERFPGGTWLDRRDLDQFAADRPLVLVHVSGHALVANSSALRAARIDRATPDPPGGRIGRGSDGEPDGRLLEAAIPFFASRRPAPPAIDPDALVRTLRSAAALGLTTVGAMNAAPEEAVALRRLAAEGRWPGRVRVYLDGRRWQEYFEDPGGPSGPGGLFEVVGAKAFLDGAFGPRTAWLSAPYSDEPSTSGGAVASADTLRAWIREITARGLAPALHAIGDAAVALALDLLEGVTVRHLRRARIEHVSLTPPLLLPKLARARPAIVVQPGFVWSDAWLGRRLGRDRARWAYAFRTLSEQGHRLVGSSDAPYDSFDPWRGLRAAVQRTDPSGRSANPDPAEALDAEEALRLYTANAGAVFGEPRLGWLEAGSPADLVRVRAPSLDAAISTGAPVVRETWIAGTRLDAPADATGARTR